MTDASIRARPRPPSLQALFIGTLGLAGWVFGARPIGDNSMFVHLRTGIDIVDGLGIPRRDRYSFTARGEEWVVQSWLPELTYGWAERLGGVGLVILEQAVLMGVLALLIGLLARSGSPLRTLGAGGLALGAGIAFWSPRPLLFGLVCMALTILVVERRVSPWLLLPVVWVWVNSHGSFPLGLAWLGVVGLGTWIDARRFPIEMARYAGAFVLGLVVACINPLGPRLLTFALTVGDKREIFSQVVEWRSPDFQSGVGMFTLLFLVPALAVLVRARPPWRDVLVVVVFLALGLIALRNLAVLAIVLAAPLGRALSPSSGVVESGSRGASSRTNIVFAAVLGVASLLFGIGGYTGRGIDERSYPVAALRFLNRQGLLSPSHRLATTDVVGGYLILERGTRANVFIDDRVDMYPVPVSRDYIRLLHAEPGALRVLERRRVDLVLWEAERPLTALLAAAPEWKQTYRRSGWAVFQRSTSMR